MFIYFFFIFSIGKTDMVLGKKVAIFDWEWGRNSAPRDRQKVPCNCHKWREKRVKECCIYP